MSTDYVAPDPKIGEFVARMNRECEQQEARLQSASNDELKTVLRDRSESNAARTNALFFLLKLKDPELPDLVLELLDDPDPRLWQSVIIYRQFRQDPRINPRLHEMLKSDDEDEWPDAAVALAMAGDLGLLPMFRDWLTNGDEAHRNVSVEALRVFKGEESLAVLRDFWDGSGGDDELRLCVAGALLDRGDARGRSLLIETAQRAQGIWSVVAATSVYVAGRNDCRGRDGLALMRHILTTGDLESRQGMVQQIYNFAHLPHAFVADGLSEAIVWVDSELQKQVV